MRVLVALLITCQMLKPNTDLMQTQRQLWMWTQGFIQIVLCYHFRADKYNSKLKSILEVSNTNPENYMFALLTSPNAVYLKSPCSNQTNSKQISSLFLNTNQIHTYLGSTIKLSQIWLPEKQIATLNTDNSYNKFQPNAN